MPEKSQWKCLVGVSEEASGRISGGILRGVPRRFLAEFPKDIFGAISKRIVGKSVEQS